MKVKQVIFSFIILFLIILLIPLLFPFQFPAYNRMLLDVTPTGILSIAGAAPQVLNIYINETPGADQLCTSDPYDAQAQTNNDK